MNLRTFLFAAALVAGTWTSAPAHAEDDSMTALQKGCAAGNASNCNMINNIKELQTSCDAGKGSACNSLGGTLGLGIFFPADLPGARKAYEKGCKLKDTNACVGLYKMVALGRGGPQDLKRAKELEPAACNTGILVLTVDLEQSGLCKKP